jgi:hypothetical protein
MITFQMTELGCTDDRDDRDDRGRAGGPCTFGFRKPRPSVPTRGQCMISLFQFPPGSNLPFFCTEAMLLPRVYLANNRIHGIARPRRGPALA